MQGAVLSSTYRHRVVRRRRPARRRQRPFLRQRRHHRAAWWQIGVLRRAVRLLAVLHRRLVLDRRFLGGLYALFVINRVL